MHNSYDPLMDLSTEDTEQTETSPTSTLKPQKPPPIFVPGVVSVPTFINCLKQKVAETDFSYKMYKEEIKILPNSIEAYRSLVRLLNENNAMYHTYQLKQERAFRVILRNMHHSVDTQSIITELREQGHNVRNLYNIRHRVTKEPLPLSYIDLEPKSNNKDIY